MKRSESIKILLIVYFKHKNYSRRLQKLKEKLKNKKKDKKKENENKDPFKKSKFI